MLKSKHKQSGRRRFDTDGRSLSLDDSQLSQRNFETFDYRIMHVPASLNDSKCVSLQKDGKLISFWNDVSLYNSDNTLNMVCEIPKWTREKMEIDVMNEPPHCIRQDRNIDGSLREYKWGDMLFNYGAFPQTWENPDKHCIYTNKKGDGDPLDVIDIGSTQAKIGLVYKVRVLGILGMIDQDEADWKVIVINVCDVHANSIHDIHYVERYKPGTLCAIRKWLKLYKTADGKPENTFSFYGQYKNKTFALSIIQEMHKDWQMLRKRKINV